MKRFSMVSSLRGIIHGVWFLGVGRDVLPVSTPQVPICRPLDGDGLSTAVGEVSLPQDVSTSTRKIESSRTFGNWMRGKSRSLLRSGRCGEQRPRLPGAHARCFGKGSPPRDPTSRPHHHHDTKPCGHLASACTIGYGDHHD